MSKKVTLKIKKEQCSHCKRADKKAFRIGEPCCPLPNPQIRNGICIDWEPSKRGIKFNPEGEKE